MFKYLLDFGAWAVGKGNAGERFGQYRERRQGWRRQYRWSVLDAYHNTQDILDQSTSAVDSAYSIDAGLLRTQFQTELTAATTFDGRMQAARTYYRNLQQRFERADVEKHNAMRKP